MKKVQPTNNPKHAHVMRNVREEKRKKRKKTSSSPFSSSSSLKDERFHNPLPYKDEEDNSSDNSSPKQAKDGRNKKLMWYVHGHKGIVSLRREVKA